MGMYTYVQGIVPPDDDWKRKKAAFDACRDAGIAVPKELSDYFEGEWPDDAGVIVDLDNSEAISEYNKDSSSGFEVDISKLNPKIKKIRFVNSY